MSIYFGTFIFTFLLFLYNYEIFSVLTLCKHLNRS